MNFHCIADENTVRGFRLAGVAGQVVTTRAEAVAALKALSSNPSCAILILSEAVAAWMPQEIADIRFQQVKPLLVEIPDASGPSSARKSLRQLVQEAVGIALGKEASS